MFEVDGCERCRNGGDAIDERRSLIDDDDAFAADDAQTTAPLARIRKVWIERLGANRDVGFVRCTHELIEEPSEVHEKSVRASVVCGVRNFAGAFWSVSPRVWRLDARAVKHEDVEAVGMDATTKTCREEQRFFIEGLSQPTVCLYERSGRANLGSGLSRVNSGWVKETGGGVGEFVAEGSWAKTYRRARQSWVLGYCGRLFFAVRDFREICVDHWLTWWMTRVTGIAHSVDGRVGANVRFPAVSGEIPSA